MRAIITGATGTIGVALVKKLVENNNEVLVIARKGSERNTNIPNSPLVKILYASLDELRELRPQTAESYDVFYHLAWDGTVGAERNNLSKQCDNIKYAIDAVDLAGHFGCNTFVGVGSQAEYGRVDAKLAPDTPAYPENGYGIAKLCAGQMTALEAEKLGIRHIWIRVLSIYGPYDGIQSLVMSTIERASKNETVLCTKGEQIWDYLYSDDAAEALRMVGENHNARGVYVLGSGDGRPLCEYIKDICQVVNPEVKIDFGAIPYSENQVMFLTADITKLKEDVNWSAKTSFNDGIKKTVDYLSNKNNQLLRKV